MGSPAVVKSALNPSSAGRTLALLLRPGAVCYVSSDSAMGNSRDGVEVLELRYRSFAPFALSSPIDWAADPYGVRNWCHHFLSLRWVPGLGDADRERQVIRDFLVYHSDPTRPRSPYFDSRVADHTLAIRLGVLLRYWRQDSSDDLLRRAIRHNIERMSAQDVYPKAHNHGFMIDIALLKCALEWGTEFMSEGERDSALVRARAQLDAVLGDDCITKEHSVSYQEYDAMLVDQLVDVLEAHGGCPPSLGEYRERVLNESRRFLGYALKQSGEYHAIGDTFRKPNLNILRKLFGGMGGSASPRELTAPYSERCGVLIAPSAGFAVLREVMEAGSSTNLVHLFFTAAWHSYVHKQDDDLSFALSIDNVDVFDDPGYSDVLDLESLGVKRAEHHTTVCVSGTSWVRRGDKGRRTRLVSCALSSGVFAVRGDHERIPGLRVERTLIYIRPGLLFTVDRTDPCPPGSVEHRFVLGLGVQPELVGSDITLTREGRYLARVTPVFPGKSSWKRCESPIIRGNRVSMTTTMAFCRDGDHPWAAVLINLRTAELPPIRDANVSYAPSGDVTLSFVEGEEVRTVAVTGWQALRAESVVEHLVGQA